MSGDALGKTLRENLTVGDTVELPLAMKGPTGIAVVVVAAAEDPDDETVIPDNVIWANDDLYLTGKMPKNAVVEAEPVSVTIDGEDVLAAWDIKIYANENQRQKGKTWQPAGDKVQVHMRSDAFLGTSGELNVYHLADAGSAAEYVDSVTASDSWVEFDAASFSAYAISTVLEKTITATDDNTYKITVAYDSASGIPAGAALAVSEITDPAAYRAYLDSAAETLSVSLENLTYTRLFDISVVGPDGQSYQPNDAVSVTVELMEPEARSVDDMRVVHFGSAAEKFTDEAASANALRAARFGGAAEELAAETANGTVSFKTEGFSVFSFLDTSVIDRVVGAIFGTSSKLYENDDIILTGRMPLLGTVEAAPVTVELEGKNVLLAYDIKIYANSLMKLLGIAWQPSEGAITVQVKSDVLTDGSKLSVYHMKDVKAKAEFVADVIAVNSSVTFEADSFSVYPVTGEDAHRIFYTFYNGSTVLAQEYITKIQEFYDPGVSPEYGQTFLGWAYNSAETDESNMLTWEQLKTDLQALLNAGGYKDGKEVNVYAKFKEAYYLRYMVMEDDGTVGVLKSESVRTDAADKTKTVNCEYSAVGSDFEGWIDAATGTSYQNGDAITLDHHIDLYAKLTGRYWLVFNSNTTGATFTGPQLIFGGAVTAKPTDPTKKGYTFIGWNTKADGSGEWWYKADGSVTSRFGGTITADTTLYAQWEGAPNSYTVVYMKQTASDDVGLANSAKQYEYVESQTVTGVKTGDVITLPAGYNSKGTTTDTNSHYYQTQYSWTDWESGMTVGADGDTVVKVYYDRKDYHLYFQIYDYTYTPTTSNNGTQYGIVNGAYARIYYRNNAWRTTDRNNGPVYSGTRYTRSGSQSWQTIKDIHALYEHDVSGQFPIVGDDGTSYDSYVWDPQNDREWKQIMVYVDSMPDRNVTFHGNGPSTPSKFMRYYVEVLPGETGTLTYNGVQYIQHGETYSAAYTT